MKKYIKFLMRIITLPLVILYKVASISGENSSLFCTIGHFLAIFPGKIGSLLRVAFYSAILPDVSTNIYIDFGSFFAHPEVTVEEGVYIGAYCIIGKCTIGPQTLIGSHVNILSGSHQHFFTDPEKKIKSQGGDFTSITIGMDSWIGNNAVIMANIGNRSIIGAGSVVTKTIPSYSMAVGNPCRIVKELR